jgi:YVTN family beta-propeller protein
MTKTAAVTLFAAFVSAAVLGSSFTPGEETADVESRPDADAKAVSTPQQPATVGHPTFVSPHASPIAISGGHVFVVNTPSDTVDVIDAKTREIVARVNVGIDPVGIAVRPDGKEVWVSNHISDSVSVIDNDPKSPTYLQVIATIQEFDPETKATRFDEPVGIAFASNEKAYVALSSENEIAVINVASREVSKRLSISAQDPRAITVRGDRLYVIPFESNNKTQLSGGSKDKIDGDLVTFDAWQHSIRVNNVLSLGHVVDIIKHPDVPDHDLYVFDTRTDQLVETVDTLGTLLYGLTVDSKGRVFVAQTDARNAANGRAGTKKHSLKELENRAFLNQITSVGFEGGSAEQPKFIDLEPLPPTQPEKGQALATPFAIQISDDDSTLIASAAGSDKLFTVDAASGAVLGRVAVGAVPRGIALENTEGGKASHAWVLNAVANTVSVVDVSDPANPMIVGFVPLKDPTHRQVKLGRTWFNDADTSTTGTFSCASCHPDGHTDQLLWVIKTPIVTGGDQIMPRSTMPIRGLRDTAPFHWDGVPGDPYGGINSANIRRHVPPNSSVDDQTTSTRHVIDGGLATTMFLEGDTTVNDEGKAGALSAAERDDMAIFLLSVPYPPAQKRSYTNVISSGAARGFRLFHIDGDLDPSKARPNVCGNCHRMPFLVSTNTPGTGMDAPTWRGANDRFLILPQGRLNIIEFDFYERVAQRGIPERNVWQFSWGGRRRFDPVWNMVLEGSTGVSGSFARQVTLSKASANDDLTDDLLSALELSAGEGAVVLEGEGVFIDGSTPNPVALQFDGQFRGGVYVKKDGNRESFTRQELVSLASAGKFVGTFTARHGAKADVNHPQPAIWSLGPIEKQRGRQEFPILHGGKHSMTISGRHIGDDANVIVDGRRVPGSVSLEGVDKIVVKLSTLPSDGMHLLQIQNADGLFSNDFIFHVTTDAEAAVDLKRGIDESHGDPRDTLARAIAKGNIDLLKKILGNRARRINDRRPQGGSTPLSTAALHGHLEIAKYLIRRGAKVEGTNNDGNTPLHVAAFMCRTEIVKLLLQKGASPLTKNKRGETAAGVVSSPWSQELADFYTGIGSAVGLKVDLKRMEQTRPQIAKLLSEKSAKSEQGDKTKETEKSTTQ